jgi:hypothetical protein
MAVESSVWVRHPYRVVLHNIEGFNKQLEEEKLLN